MQFSPRNKQLHIHLHTPLFAHQFPSNQLQGQYNCYMPAMGVHITATRQAPCSISLNMLAFQWTVCPMIWLAACPCLKVCIQLEVVQVASEARHHTRLLVVCHALLKEVGLAPADIVQARGCTYVLRAEQQRCTSQGHSELHIAL